MCIKVWILTLCDPNLHFSLETEESHFYSHLYGININLRILSAKEAQMLQAAQGPLKNITLGPNDLFTFI